MISHISRPGVMVVIWLTASVLGCSSSTGGQLTCVADIGCPEAAQPTICSTRPDTVLEVEAAHDRAAELAGQVVSVRGYLTRVGNACTELGCLETACCNHCDGHLALVGEPRDRLVYPLPSHIVLGDDNAEEWSCEGDDTGLCCHYAIDGVVVLATGTIEEAAGTTAGVRLQVDSLCTP